MWLFHERFSKINVDSDTFFKRSKGESLGSICSACVDGSIFQSLAENSSVEIQVPTLLHSPSCADFPSSHPSSSGKVPDRHRLDKELLQPTVSCRGQYGSQDSIHNGRRLLVNCYKLGGSGRKEVRPEPAHLQVTSPTPWALGCPGSQSSTSSQNSVTSCLQGNRW